ncbi:unnamed protein product [Ectocarpus sp. 13 AM-2016]
MYHRGSPVASLPGVATHVWRLVTVLGVPLRGRGRRTKRSGDVGDCVQCTGFGRFSSCNNHSNSRRRRTYS